LLLGTTHWLRRFTSWNYDCINWILWSIQNKIFSKKHELHWGPQWFTIGKTIIFLVIDYKRIFKWTQIEHACTVTMYVLGVIVCNVVSQTMSTVVSDRFLYLVICFLNFVNLNLCAFSIVSSFRTVSFFSPDCNFFMLDV